MPQAYGSHVSGTSRMQGLSVGTAVLFPWSAHPCTPAALHPQEHYPELMKDVKIRIIELMDHVLSTYDRKISEYTAKRFARAGGRRYWCSLCRVCA